MIRPHAVAVMIRSTVLSVNFGGTNVDKVCDAILFYRGMMGFKTLLVCHQNRPFEVYFAILPPMQTGRIITENKSNYRLFSEGEAYYINPTDGKVLYLKDGSSAYQIMRNLSVGITNMNLSRILTE